jgi:carboxylesterase type B
MDIVSSYWANFIKTGDPNGEGLPCWNQKAPDSGHMRLDLDCRMEADYVREEEQGRLPLIYKWMKAELRAALTNRK